MELHEALGRIAEIREQMVRSSMFHGYRAVPVAASGVVAAAAAVLQPTIVAVPSADVGRWATLWVVVALASAVVAGTETVLRYRRATSELARARTRLALGQFAPCLVAGAALGLVLARTEPGALWILPGVWTILFGLGVAASRPVLPRPFVFVAAWYVVAGLVVLALARGEDAFSPLAMGVPFGVGQIFAAVLLHWTLERNHDGEAREEA